MSLFRRTASGGSRQAVLPLAAAILLSVTAIQIGAADPAGKNPPAAARKVVGYALDELGRPVSGATVCLTRATRSEDGNDCIVIAHTRSEAGRFDLIALESDFKQAKEDPPAVFELWICKAGCGLAHRFIFNEGYKEPQIVSMRKDSPATICLHKPDGSLCGDATVSPVGLWLTPGFGSGLVPQLIRDQLRAHSTADGRVTIPGLMGQVAIVAIETTRFGEQQIVIPSQTDPPTAVTLRETRAVEGRLIVRDGKQIDLSKLTVRIREVSSETGPDGTAASSDKQPGAPRPGTCYARFIVRPDREGRFAIAKFPKFEHGHFSIGLSGPDEIPYTNDPHDCDLALKGPPNQPIKIDISVRKGCWVSRVVRDAHTKRTLAGIEMKVESSNQGSLQDESDENGLFRVCLCPGTYHVQCHVPDGYLRAASGSEDDIVVPPGAERLELKPIELVAGVAVQGKVLDVAGQRLAGIRIRGTWRAGDLPTGTAQAAEVGHWATTDSAGHFQFADVEAGTHVALVAVRAGVALADPVQIVASSDNPVRLQESKTERTALSGRILDTEYKPIPGAQVVIEVEHSLDPTRTFRTTTDSAGSFQTAPDFPKQLKYRVTVRAILKDVASSAWICPARTGSRFRDLVVERSKLGLDTRIFGKEVVALVDGRPILASEIFERAYPEPLSPDGLSLLIAANNIENGRVTEGEYRALQETAIRKYAADYARTRMLSRAYEAKLDQQWKEKTEQAILKMFEEYVEKLKTDLKASDRDRVERKLREQGTSLASLKVEFRYRLLADEYLRQATPPASEIGWQRALDYYTAHRQKYAVQEKVTWQLLEINFADPSNQVAKTETVTASDDQAAHWEITSKAGVEVNSWSVDQTRLVSPIATTTKSPDTTKDCGFDIPAAWSESVVSREEARQALAKAIACEWMGLPFEKIVKKFSAGARADQGGWQPRVRPESVADAKTSAALRELPEGATSGLIETDHSFRLVRVACRTPASYQPFEDVEQSIREHMRRELQKKALKEIYSRTAIESPFIDEADSVLQQTSSPAPAKTQDDAFAP